MPRYRVVWLEIAERQYIDLPDTARDLADHLLAGLEQSPTNMSGAVYNHTSDQWSAPLGDQGFGFYAGRSGCGGGLGPTVRRHRRHHSTGERRTRVNGLSDSVRATTRNRRPVTSSGSMRTKRCFGAACHGNRGRSVVPIRSCSCVISRA